MKKVRLGNLDIYCPKRNADWRVSVNLEVPGTLPNVLNCPSYYTNRVAHISIRSFAVPPPIGSSTHTRRKDRMSYTHEEFIIDLTQVTASFAGNPKVRLPLSPRYHQHSAYTYRSHLSTLA